MTWCAGLLRTAFVATSLALGVAACGPIGAPGSPGRPLPSYAGRASELFDDGIEPAAVGLDFDKGYSPKSDAMLRERAQVSDAVLRVRVATVTGKQDGPETTFQLGIHTLEKLAGDNPPPTDFTVGVNRSSESHGILKNFEGRLVGAPFIAFVREFVRADGDREIHFHLSPDTAEVKAAVGNAVILGEVGPSGKK
jgi:hypothetical protein